jgi:hypothetical protein
MPMRNVLSFALVLATAASVACGSADRLTAPPPSELSFAASFNPDTAGGMRPSTTVTAWLFLQPHESAVAGTPAEKAEFTVWDGAGRELAQASVPGPLPFEPDGRITARQVLDWKPADALGRALTVRFIFGRTAPEASPLIIERTVTF